MSQQMVFLPPTPEAEKYRDVWVLIEFIGGELVRHSLESLGAARKIASKVNMRIGAVVLGHAVPRDTLESLIHYGADYVVYADHEDLRDYNALLYAKALVDLCRQYRPWALIVMADEIGRDVAPRVAYRLVTGLATDNIDFEVEDFYHGLLKQKFEGILAQVRPDFATRIAKIYTPRHRPQVASLRPGYFKPPPKDPSRKGEIFVYKPTFSKDDYKIKVLRIEKIEDPGAELEEADVVIGLGLGILRDAEGNPMNPLDAVKYVNEIKDLLNKLGIKASIGATRALIFSDIKELRGIITRDRQVGQTGKTVSPKVYIAVGISGAVQHKVGILRAKNIVAINIDPNAPIFEISHYVIQEDLYKALPKLYEALRKRLSAHG